MQELRGLRPAQCVSSVPPKWPFVHAYADVANATICEKAKSVNTKTQTNVTPKRCATSRSLFSQAFPRLGRMSDGIFNARSSFGTKIALNVLPENTGANG